MKDKGSMGISALVCGLVGLFFLPIPLSILAVIFGAIGLKRQEKYAKAGLILGIISIVWYTILIIFLVTILIASII